ncbi:MAG: AmmeMemoRadiSam system protein B [Candidatus Margulisbacteria bacterium GWF2_35_9]|nr:MAG: AmmeMemoRadiSam system protein B [Candidatus Margulisbacteria bacterium GWF2_35_9]
MNILRSSFSGSFYPQNATVLSKQVHSYLSKIQKTVHHPKALIVPHAGYVYSGQVAAHGYKQLEKESYQTAIILGPSHQIYNSTLAIPVENAYINPLGTVPFNESIINDLLESSLFISDSSPHYQEHSIEVQLPFLQVVQPNINIVPISVGSLSTDALKQAGKVLSKFITDDTILIISNDLSHFHSLNTAKMIDQKTIDAILSMDVDRFITAYQQRSIECCGFFPIALALATFENLKSIKATLLKYDTSASTSFDDQRVVGYTSISFC